MIRSQMFIAVALLVGVAIGYCVKDEPRSAETTEPVEEPVKKPLADKGEEASVKALRHRITELERALAEKGEKSEVAISNAVAEAAKHRPPEPPQANWRERMEEMKKRDPERYTQMTNRFAQWRRSRAERAQGKIGFLSSIDTSHMSAGAKKTHADLQKLIAKSEEIAEQLHQEDLSDEERGRLMGEMREAYHEMRHLNVRERRNLFEETARNLGFEGDDVQEISATLQDIIDATDSGFGPGGPGGR